MVRRSTADCWPQFHGPRRDNISLEKGLRKFAQEGGPPLIWQSRCGMGHDSPAWAIARGRILTAGDRERITSSPAWI